MRTWFFEASQGGTGNWGKFMIARFDADEWARRSTLPEAANLPLVPSRGWTRDHVLFMDLQTGEGCMLYPHANASAHADLDKHRVWVCPLAEPWLEWLYQQNLRDLDAVPSYVELPDAPFAMAGYRRAGSTT